MRIPYPGWILVVLACARPPAQCNTAWGPLTGSGGLNAPGYATVCWDPDGAGPIQEHLVVGGEFTSVASITANHVAAYDPAGAAWHALGQGMNGTVRALCVLPNGDLVAGGEFTTAGGAVSNRLARWDGVAWAPLGTGANGAVRALAVSASGDLIAGGDFTVIGGVAAARVARWDGVAWSAMANGVDGTVHALHALGSGVVVGGAFTSAGVPDTTRIALWTTGGFVAMGAGLSVGIGNQGAVRSLALTAANELIAGGDLLVPYPGSLAIHNGVARWNGTAWASFGTPLPAVHGLVVRPTGEVVAASGDRVHAGNGGTWQLLGDGLGQFEALELLANGDICALGNFVAINQVYFDHVALLGTAGGWSTVPPGSFAALSVEALARAPNGDVYAGGALSVGGNSSWIARWNGSTWSGLGGGLNEWVHAVEVLANGDVVAGGLFSMAGGVPVTSAARWDGTQWHAMPGAPHGIRDLVALPNGGVVACGAVTVARWDGSSWHPYPSGHPAQPYRALLRTNGHLVVAGLFSGAGFTVAEWDGANWAAVGGIVPGWIEAMAELPDGDLIVGGTFTSVGGLAANHIARWDGAQWHPIGAGLNGWVEALAVLPNGDIVAGSVVPVSPNNTTELMRWDGASWSPTPALGAASVIAGRIYAMLPPDTGELFLGGRFTTAGGAPSAAVARLVTDCPPGSVVTGAGCVGSAGLVELRPSGLPWLDARFRARATGLTANAFAVGVFSFSQTSVPLAQAHPLGLPGCTILVDDEILIQFVVGAGEVRTEIAIPNQPMLIGATFYHQVVPIEIDLGGSITALTSSNALTLTIGAF